MSIITFLLIIVYIVLLARNYSVYRDNPISSSISIITTIILIYFLCGNNYASIDWSETELDLSGYRTVYERYDILAHPDFNMYYIYYGSMHLGQILGISFDMWWAIMSVLAMSVIFIACKIHNFSYNLFLASFMAFYIFIMYSGLKFFYGFCFLLLAYGFLLRDTKKGNILFALFTCIAGGLHMMYYFYLILLVKPKNNPNSFVKVVVSIAVFLTLIMKISGSAVSVLLPFFNSFENEHIDSYTGYNVGLGFFIPIVLHLMLVSIVSKIYKYTIQHDLYSGTMNMIYYSTILSLLFCPFYAVALTFMRLITAFSLVVITATSNVLSESLESRKLLIKMSLLMAGSFIFMKLISGAEGFINNSVIPFFNVL